ncbi:MAG: hypothetical protein Q7J79_08500 [Gemmatimonadales bacterium]|nr:hypothetical protein [Gemmatimonadales bacterium]
MRTILTFQEIRGFYPSRGHTAGDVVVQLPAEGLLLPALRGGINPANVTRTYAVVTGRAN